MRITIRHEGTEVVVDEAVLPGVPNEYGTSRPTKIRFTDDHPYVMKTLEKMAEQLIRIRRAEQMGETPLLKIEWVSGSMG
jgi:hypothetical protein